MVRVGEGVLRGLPVNVVGRAHHGPGTIVNLVFDGDSHAAGVVQLNGDCSNLD